MKIFSLLVLVLISSYSLCAYSCIKTNFCKGCSNVDNVCDACFNWGSDARLLVATTCITKRVASLVTNCQIYKSNSSTDVVTYDTCHQCSGGKVINAAQAAAGTWTVTCISATTAKPKLDAVKCMSGSTFYSTTAAGATTYSTPRCFICQAKYQPTTVTTFVFNSCMTAVSTANCMRGNFNNAGNGAACLHCNSKYALTQALACVAWSDSNCQKLITGDTKCSACWVAYIFDGTKCVKAASILSIAFVGLLALFN